MGIQDDLQRLKELIEEESRSFREYLKHGELGKGRQIPNIDPPQYDYGESGGKIIRGNPWREIIRRQMQQGGMHLSAQQRRPRIPGETEDGRPRIGTPIPKPGGGGGEGDEDESDAGEGEGEHQYIPIDDEEFIDFMEEEFEFILEPTDKENATEMEETDPTGMRRSGPKKLRYDEKFMKRGLKRAIAYDQEDEFAKDLLKVEGVEPEDAYWWLRNSDKHDLDDIPGADHDLNPGIRNIGLNWFEKTYQELKEEGEHSKYSDIEEFLEEAERKAPAKKIRSGELSPLWKKEDEKYREFDREPEEDNNLVLFNIRDVSASISEEKRDLIERIFWPINRYLKAKYDNGIIVSIFHDSNSWEVKNSDFFGRESGGGTSVEAGYELAQAIAEGEFEEFYDKYGKLNRDGTERILESKHPKEGYPAENWNRYVLGAGDGENLGDNEYVAELIREIEANRHGYFDVRPGRGGDAESSLLKTLKGELEREEGYVLDTVSSKDDIPRVIEVYLDERGDQ